MKLIRSLIYPMLSQSFLKLFSICLMEHRNRIVGLIMNREEQSFDLPSKVTKS